MAEEKKDNKEAMKRLREQRKAYIEAARQKIKEQNQMVKKIKEVLASGGKTVPELSEALQTPTSEAMWYVTALRKYGILKEGDKDGDYYKYELAEA